MAFSSLLLSGDDALGITSSNYAPEDFQTCLRRRKYGERGHDAVGVLLADFRQQQGPQSRAGAPSERMRQLKSLHAVAAFSFFAHDVQDGVDQLGPLCVVTLRPVVSFLTECKLSL